MTEHESLYITRFVISVWHFGLEDHASPLYRQKRENGEWNVARVKI